jgi:hypothetical protein
MGEVSDPAAVRSVPWPGTLARAGQGRGWITDTVGHEQRLEGPRVPYRVRVAVVVEVDKHVLVGQAPFPDPVSPPPQVGAGVGTRVQVMIIWAVPGDGFEAGPRDW